MTVADKLLQINQAKQDMKTALEVKGIPMTNVAFSEYANKILSIGGGGVVVDEYYNYAKEIFAMSDKVDNLNVAWEDYKRTTELKYDLNLTLAASDVYMLGFDFDIYIGDSVLTQLYNDCVNGVINYGDLYVLAHDDSPLTARIYFGDMSDAFGIPFPLYGFGLSGETWGALWSFVTAFLVADLTPLDMGLGISLVKFTTGLTFDNIKVYEKYYNYRDGLIADLNEVESFPFVVYDFPLVITDSPTSIGGFAFYNWTANNHPLVIPDSVTRIGDGAFSGWAANDYPLVIPNSVTNIGEDAFSGWQSNNQALVIPNSVTSIGLDAFSDWSSNDHPLVIPNSVTSISYRAFSGWSSNNQPLVIPDSVTSIDYAAFENWSSNDQQLVIPDSVTSIGYYAFSGWSANTHPLIIPNSVISIGNGAFSDWSLVPYVEIQAITPPTLVYTNAFDVQNNAPIYVPDESLEAYKTATNWVSLASRIFPISDISDVVDEYFNYAEYYYTATNNSTLFENAWEHSLTVDPLEISENSSSANPRGTAQYPNGETEGVIIPQGVITIGQNAFRNWTSNNLPLVIPDSVTSIGLEAFRSWSSNNHPLVIPNSVTNIGAAAFRYWRTNNQPLIIPSSVTSIGIIAFDSWTLVPYVEMQAITPPTLVNINAFDGQNDAPIYVPDESVTAYKTATNWVSLSDRIFSINDK